MGIETRSSSMEGLVKELGDRPVMAGEVVKLILDDHGHYGDKTASVIDVVWPSGSVTLTIEEWLAEITRLYHNDAFEELHGRAVILGLALLDPPSGRAAVEAGLFYSIANELRPSLGAALAPAGQERLALIPLAGFVAGVDPVTLATGVE